jgi:hypothetical protein
VRPSIGLIFEYGRYFFFFQPFFKSCKAFGFNGAKLIAACIFFNLMLRLEPLSIYFSFLSSVNPFYCNIVGTTLHIRAMELYADSPHAISTPGLIDITLTKASSFPANANAITYNFLSHTATNFLCLDLSLNTLPESPASS